MIGRQVYRLDLTDFDGKISLTYMFDLSTIIDADADLNEDKMIDLIMNDELNKGVLSRDIVKPKSTLTLAEYHHVNELRFFTIDQSQQARLISQASSNTKGQYTLIDGIITTSPLKNNNSVNIKFQNEDQI